MRESHSVTTTHKAAALFVALALATPGWAQAPALPSSPQTINVIDVAGNLALTQKGIERYRADDAKTVSRITFTKAPAPELAGKIKAQQDAGRVDIDLVLTGTDGLAAGIEGGSGSNCCRNTPTSLAASKESTSRAQGRCRSSPRTKGSSSPNTPRDRPSSTCQRR
jgi:hypothetical protein